MKKNRLQRIKKWLKKTLPRGVEQVLEELHHKIKYKEFCEKKCEFGSLNPERTFYLIRLMPPGMGLLSNYLYVIGHIKFAKQKGYLPIVDMQNYKTVYSENEPVNGTMNAWEYYWKQPTNVTLEEVYQSKNVILSAGWLHGGYGISVSNLDNRSFLEEAHNISLMISFSDSILEHIAQILPKQFNEQNRILGVAARGSDYNSLKPFLHAIQPTALELAEIAAHRYDEWKCDFIYLKTEDEETLEIFKKMFGSKLIYSPQKRYPPLKNGENLIDYELYENNNKYCKDRDYLSEIIIISKCHNLISGINAGLKTALIMNGGKYENVEIINLGTYDN